MFLRSQGAEHVVVGMTDYVLDRHSFQIPHWYRLFMQELGLQNDRIVDSLNEEVIEQLHLMTKY